MIGRARRLRFVAWTVLFGVCAAAIGLAPPLARAAINLTGEVVPSPPVGDPWNVGGQLSIGDAAIGTMVVNGGSDVSNADGYVGNLAGSDGTVTVSGVGSTWANAGELRMGNFGKGTLNIAAGGVVSSTGNTRVGNSEGGIGIATLDGAGSMLTSDMYILVGRAGNGTFNIQNGGVASDLIGGIAIFEGSTGVVTITGTGSAWNNTNELQVADGGNATLNILNGATASATQGYLGVSADGVGTVTVSGAGSAWNNSNQLQVGYVGHGTINVVGHGTLSSSLGYVGVLAGGTGNVTVSGDGSMWNNANDLYVGYEGAGTLNVQDGGTVTSGLATIGTNSGSSGTVTVSGSGSTWTNSGLLQVGSAATGTLNVENGGLVSTSSLGGGNATSGIYFNGGTLRIMSTGFASNAVTLTGGGAIDVSTTATTFTLGSNIAGAGGLTKIGVGALELTGANAYGGDTKVAAGALSIGQATLNDVADVYLSTGAAMGLNFTGTDNIDSLFVGGLSQAVGTYGAVGSGANFERAYLSGTGLLRVTSLGVPGDFNDDGTVSGSDYVAWRKTDGSAFGYGLWRANFGRVLGAGTGTFAVSEGQGPNAIPEPMSVVLFLLGSAMLASRAAGRRRIRGW